MASHAIVASEKCFIASTIPAVHTKLSYQLFFFAHLHRLTNSNGPYDPQCLNLERTCPTPFSLHECAMF